MDDDSSEWEGSVTNESPYIVSSISSHYALFNFVATTWIDKIVYTLIILSVTKYGVDFVLLFNTVYPL